MAVCQSNLKQLGSAFHLYLNDWDGIYPPALSTRDIMGGTGAFVPTWRKRIFSNLKSSQVYKCPSNDFTERVVALPSFAGHAADTYYHEMGFTVPFSYAMNDNEFNVAEGGDPNDPDPYAVPESEITTPSQVVLLMETQSANPTINYHYFSTNYSQVPEYSKQLQPPYGSSYFSHTDDGRSNWLFCDGSVRSLRLKDTLTPRNLWLDDGAYSRYHQDNAAIFRYIFDLTGLGVASSFPPKWR
jgi:prepilin-type processing-associated H-X9-DG protein